MSDLTISRKRDAYFVIKGFVYQVELTIDRWLKLGESEILELEAGEDIDIVKAVSKETESNEFERILEQVKVRKTNLTLKSPPALTALASFYEHDENNPSGNLNFHYITNAKIGTEKPSPVEGKTPLIRLWEDLRLEKIKGKARNESIKIIKAVLEKAKKPGKFNKEVWSDFKKFVENSSLKKPTSTVGSRLRTKCTS